MSTAINSVGIVGAGQMGSGIAQVCAQAGLNVVINDVSARDIQNAHGGQFFKGKSLDTFCPMGPVVVTADEFGDPHHKRVTCRVNGVEKQNASTPTRNEPCSSRNRIPARLGGGGITVPAASTVGA